MVPATNTVLKCELCTLAYILRTVEGQSFKMVATCIHTLHTFPCNEAIMNLQKVTCLHPCMHHPARAHKLEGSK